MTDATERPKSGVETLGQRLRRLRKERGLSQRDLARAGVSYAYVSRIEKGTRQPSVKVLRRLARALGVSAEYLETGLHVGPRERREMRLRDAELSLRLEETTASAERALAAILEEAERDGDRAGAARARAGLALAALRRGEYARAIAELETVVSSQAVSPSSHPELFGMLGRAYAGAGDPQRAISLFEECLGRLDRDDLAQRQSAVRFSLYLSYALADAGDLDRARGLLSQVLAEADELIDPYMRVRLYWSQARLAAQLDDPSSALHNLRQAVALLEATEDRRQLGRAHLLWAEILVLEGRTEEASSHLALAEDCLAKDPDHEDRCWLLARKALQAGRSGRGEEAVSLARQALDLLGDHDPREQGVARWALGLGLAARGDLDGAEEALTTALDLLCRATSFREAIEASRDWASILRSAGRMSEALAVLERATELSRRLSLRLPSPS